jgi:hypothetical protein
MRNDERRRWRGCPSRRSQTRSQGGHISPGCRSRKTLRIDLNRGYRKCLNRQSPAGATAARDRCARRKMRTSVCQLWLRAHPSLVVRHPDRRPSRRLSILPAGMELTRGALNQKAGAEKGDLCARVPGRVPVSRSRYGLGRPGLHSRFPVWSRPPHERFREDSEVC